MRKVNLDMKPSNIFKKLSSLGAPNAVLVIVGLTLIALSAAWRFAVAPALKVVASDFDNFYSYDGKVSIFSANQVVSELPVIVEQRQYNRFELTTPEISTVEEHIRLLNGMSKSKIAERKNLFRVNRRTCELTQSRELELISSKKTYYIVFPFCTPKTSLYYDNGMSYLPAKARYTGKRKLKGMELWDYMIESTECYAIRKEHQDFVKQLLKLLPEGHPIKNAKLSWAEDKNQDENAFRILFGYKARILVEPSMGTIAGVQDVEETFFAIQACLKSTEYGVVPPAPLVKLNFSMRESSLKEALDLARDEREKMNLNFKYIPTGFLIIGIMALCTGIAIGVKEKSENERV